jgi:DNA-binding response OmpR family regulator
MGHRILAVDDSSETIQLIRRALGSGYQIDVAMTAHAATEMLAKHTYSLILLDVQLPDGDGFKVCSVLQTEQGTASVPIVFLTAKTSIEDKILGFQLGAEDFITKPFDQMELKARVDAKLRKIERDRVESDIVRVGDLEINKGSQRAIVSKDGASTELELTPLEFKLLLLLASKPSHVFSRDEILNTVWGESIHVYSRSVDTHISKLRKKLEAHADLIESVHGMGYRIGESKNDRMSSLHGSLQSGVAFA